MRVSEVSFYDALAQSGELQKPMDFPLALMKTVHAVAQDGHKLFRCVRHCRTLTNLQSLLTWLNYSLSRSHLLFQRSSAASRPARASRW